MLGPARRRGVVDDYRVGSLGPALGKLVADVDPVDVVEVGAEMSHPVAVHHAREPDAQRHVAGVAGRPGGPAAAARTMSMSSPASGGVGSLSNASMPPAAPRRTASTLEPPMSTPTQEPEGTRPEGRKHAQGHNPRPRAGSRQGGETVQGHRGGGGHVERVDARRHGDAHRPAHPEHRGAQAVAFCADDHATWALELAATAPMLLGLGVRG